MNKNDLPRIIAVTIIVAVITTVLTAAGLLSWFRHNPQSFARALGSMGLDRRSGNGTTTPFFFPAESVVIEAVKKANPAVVAITISKNVPVYEQYYERIPSPFGNFFGTDPFSFSVPRLRQNGTEKKEVGGGSGFLVSADGYIVTNRHVVEDANAEYTVFMNDGKKYDAKVIARDNVLDIAVIKIEGLNFPYLPFGDSDRIEIGQSVIAIGNALAEFRNTVSLGIISGLSRSIVAADKAGGNSEALDQLIQTDAAINPGNSGGPLLNLSGEVVGINVAVASGAENIGFALSGNSVKSVVESVRKTGRIIRPYLGVRYQEVTEELKTKNNLPVDYGVLVERGQTAADPAVIPGSPADKAGIMEGDIILEIDGVRLTADKNLSALIRGKSVGEEVKLKINRKGEEKLLAATLEEMK